MIHYPISTFIRYSNKIKLQSLVIFLSFAALMLVLPSCNKEQSQQLPDIDATVQARVELIESSLVVPTAAPLPTYTPYPTYTPAPEPETVIKKIPVEKIVEVPVEIVKEVIAEKPIEVIVEKEMSVGKNGEAVGDTTASPTETPALPPAAPTGTATASESTAPVTPYSDLNPSFTINSKLCLDEQGPDCTKLRLGDDYLTTSGPAKGYLYSCMDKNPNAPGSIESAITWIDFVRGTWNFLEKLWLPDGTFSPVGGTYTETITAESRQVDVNNLPVDGNIGDWPMTNYPKLTAIDPNPGIPAVGSFSFSYPTNPSEALSPSCVSLGAIGVTKNGVIIYNAVDGRGEDAVAREIVDVFGGHPAQSDYHYHFIPGRLDHEFLSDGHSEIVGYINDGFPIYGYKGEGGVEMSNDELDACHGHGHGMLGYHYHATLEYPYTIGCYMGTPITSSPNGGQQPGQGPPGRRPPRNR